jgi:arylsulfatase B/arylsulfatase I/J
MDRLATKEGVRLENYYVQQVCTPTRSALVTGRYPFRTGMQGYATFAPGSSAAIPKDVPTIAEVLKKVGYTTHYIGKWHLGSASWDDTPTGRGFDSYAGYLQGAGNYYNHTFGTSFLNSSHKHTGKSTLNGYDFWRNRTAAWECYGEYSMGLYMREAQRVLESRDPTKPFFLTFAHQLIHQPLQKPPNHMAACDGITPDLPAGEDRNTLCQMTVELDTQIGVLVDMLKMRDLWDNTFVWVTTDNGGMTIGLKEQQKPPANAVYSVSSNYPLRGGKATLFEGGVRGVSFVSGGFLPSEIFWHPPSKSREHTLPDRRE